MQRDPLLETERATATTTVVAVVPPGAPPGAPGQPAGPLTRWRPAAGVLPVALALGWVADRLFFEQRPGLGVPFYVLLLLGALAFLARVHGARLARRNAWLLPPLLFFATMIAVRANELLTVLNALAVAMLLALVATFGLAGRLHRMGVMGYPLVAMQVLLEACLRPGPVVVRAVRRGASRRPAGARGLLGRTVPLLRGVVLAVPVLLLFTALLSAADSIFAGYVGDAARFWSLDRLPDVSEPLGHLIFVLVVAWLVCGGLLFALQRGVGEARGEALPDEARLAPSPPPLRLGFVEGATVLALVDALFALFVAVQLAYLFRGPAAAAMPFERYRDYARRGFFELLAVTVLTLGLILITRWLTSKRTVRQASALNVLCTVMIGLALVMLASAMQRLVVWEGVENYINTPVRLYVRTFTVWLALTYGWLLVTLWLRHDRFAVGAFVCTLGFLVTVNALDPDADTARYNLTRGDDLATRFVDRLSDDAVPALAAGLHTTEGENRARLRLHLTERLRQMERQEPDGGPSGWPSYHLARHRARTALLQLRAAGAID